MAWIKLFFFFLLCLAFQIKLPFYVWKLPLAVELPFVAAVSYALAHGGARGLAAGAMAGTLQAAASQVPFGFGFFSFTLIAGGAGLSRRFIFVERLTTRLALVAACSGVLFFARALFFLWRGDAFPFWTALAEGLLPMVALNAAAALPVFLAMRWLGLNRPFDGERDHRSAEFFSRFRRRLAGQSLSPRRKEWSWK